jgi:hypothetical protein
MTDFNSELLNIIKADRERSFKIDLYDEEVLTQGFITLANEYFRNEGKNVLMDLNINNINIINLNSFSDISSSMSTSFDNFDLNEIYETGLTTVQSNIGPIIIYDSEKFIKNMSKYFSDYITYIQFKKYIYAKLTQELYGIKNSEESNSDNYVMIFLQNFVD